MRPVYVMQDGRKVAYISAKEFWKLYERHTGNDIADAAKTGIVAGLFFHLLTVLTLGITAVVTVSFMSWLVMMMVSRYYDGYIRKITNHNEKSPLHWGILLARRVLDVVTLVVLVAIPAYTFTISTSDIMMKLIGVLTMYAALYAYYSIYGTALMLTTSHSKLIYSKYGTLLGESQLLFEKRMQEYNAQHIEMDDSEIDLSLRDVPAFDNPNAQNHLVSFGELFTNAFRDHLSKRSSR